MPCLLFPTKVASKWDFAPKKEEDSAKAESSSFFWGALLHLVGSGRLAGGKACRESYL